MSAVKEVKAEFVLISNLVLLEAFKSEVAEKPDKPVWPKVKVSNEFVSDNVKSWICPSVVIEVKSVTPVKLTVANLPAILAVVRSPAVIIFTWEVNAVGVVLDGSVIPIKSTLVNFV